MSKDPKKARITLIETDHRAKTVWIEVDTFEALLGYPHEITQYTQVMASKMCSEKDLEAIKAHCKDTMFMTFKGVATGDGEGGSTSEDAKDDQ